MEAFWYLDVFQNTLDLDGLKLEQTPGYAADFAKETSNIQEGVKLI